MYEWIGDKKKYERLMREEEKNRGYVYWLVITCLSRYPAIVCFAAQGSARGKTE